MFAKVLATLAPVLVATAVLTVFGCAGGSGSNSAPAGVTGVIHVRNPIKLPAQLPAVRVAVGIPGDYKPDLVLLPTGQLLLVLFIPITNPNGTYQENMILYRSSDGGITWGARETVPLLGREPYFSLLSDGTLFITASFLSTDFRNTAGYTYACVYRSTDGGMTWSGLQILSDDVPGVPPRSVTRTSRNILELTDGSLIMGVGAGVDTDYLWRSFDKGKTWDKSLASQAIGYDEAANGYPWYGEMVFVQAQNGDLLGIDRSSAGALAPLPGTQIPAGGDLVSRMALFRSRDGGSTWTVDPPIGSYYGEMYPSLKRLPGNQVLFTFTVRSLRPPLGVQAVLGSWGETGFSLSFDSDRLILDEETPLDQPSGGGFGNTVQLADATLVTAYSYRGGDSQTHVEVVRWLLPLTY
jgi:hypothetical protein